MTLGRRRLLRGVAASAGVAVAGCGGRSDDTAVFSSTDTERSESTRTRTTSPTFTELPTPTNCPSSPNLPEPETEPSGPPVPDPPDPPAELTDRRVRRYAERYEFVYRRLDRVGALPTPILDVQLSAVVTVRTRGTDWAIVDVRGLLFGEWDPDPTGTSAPGNFDDIEYIGSYLVTREAVWRAETDHGDISSEPDPVADGELLECF